MATNMLKGLMKAADPSELMDTASKSDKDKVKSARKMVMKFFGIKDLGDKAYEMNLPSDTGANAPETQRPFGARGAAPRKYIS